MSLENDLKALLPTTLWDSLLIDFDTQEQTVQLRLNEWTWLCAIQRDEFGDVHLYTSLHFRAGPDYGGSLNDVGREVFLYEDCQVTLLLGEFEDIGLRDTQQGLLGGSGGLLHSQQVYDADPVGNDLLEIDVGSEFGTLEEAATVVQAIYKLGVTHEIGLPESLLVYKAQKAFEGQLSIEWLPTVTDFRLIDSNGHVVAEYEHEFKKVRFDLVLAEWNLASDEDVSEMESQLGDYVADFFKSFESRHPFKVLSVEDISDDAGVAALNVVYATYCETLEDLKAAIASNREIKARLVEPDWIPC